MRFRSVSARVPAGVLAAAAHRQHTGGLHGMRTLAALMTGATLAQQQRAAGSRSADSSAAPSPPSQQDGVAPSVMDMPAPPRPASYVPPTERALTDESLAFLRRDDPLQRQHEAAMAEQRQHDSVHLQPGQVLAPQARERATAARQYADADAARVQSSSVHAGRSLLREGEATVGAGEYYAGQHGPAGLDGQARSRLHVLKGTARPERLGEAEEMLSAGEAAGGDGRAAAVAAAARDTMFCAKHEFSPLEDVVGENGGLPQRPPPVFGNRPGASSPDRLDDNRGGSGAADGAKGPKIPLAKQIERDIKKLEYYAGSLQYPELLRQFREKYGKEQSPDSAAAGEKEEQQKYSAEEALRGLENQPIDFHRGSSKLQVQLSSGLHGYSPVTIMQQHGVMRFQGYAFPPTTQLGKLKGVDDLKALQEAHREKGAVAAVRRSFNALIGRRDPKEDYLATEDKVKPDNHILYRTLKLDAVQRRQMRFMLTDFDYKDRNTAFHVMMSYPYTDWIHVFFMVAVGWGLYQLQVRYGAYDFYDEYLGLDLRQVPSVKRPFLCGITVVIMIFFMFQPLLVASIATNRAYRIITRRPIGPP